MVSLARKCRAACDVIVAAFAVYRARRAVAKRPLGALVGRSPQAVPDSADNRLTELEQTTAERWGVAVDRALRWVPGDSACLVRAGALSQIVQSRGIPNAVVRIGVRRGESGFEAHAWVEQDGTPIAEPTSLRGAFSSLDGVTLT